jgi:hypothetical protein
MKMRLYGQAGRPHQNSTAKEMFAGHNNASMQPSKRPTASKVPSQNFSSSEIRPEKVLQQHSANLQQVTDSKMNTFLDEMRQ